MKIILEISFDHCEWLADLLREFEDLDTTEPRDAATAGKVRRMIEEKLELLSIEE